MGYNAQDFSDAFTGRKLIYIYHNVIDGRGDKAATETEVFDATQRAFKELSELVERLRKYYSPLNVLITADHGYIYRRTPLQEYDKTPKQDLAGIVSSRRFIMAREDVEAQGMQNFSMEYLTKYNQGMYVVMPRATNCFKIQGAGSRYVHGGASLQEITIPIIRFRSDKTAKGGVVAQKVTLSLTSLSRKVTSIITHLNFHQAEPVDDKHLPLRVTAYFADEDDNRISNENIIIADSTDKSPEKRVYKEKFTLKNMAYDKGKSYFLVLKDEESVNSTLERIPFAIDLVFGGGIQF
jgi:hypothetical protein